MEYKDVIIVDNNDNILTSKPWTDIDWSVDRIRASRLWLEDSAGNVLMQQRGLTLEFNPGKYTFAVGGINDIGESYESTVKREAKEEIGIDVSEIVELGVEPLNENARKGFIKYFKCVVDGVRPKIEFDPNEVESVKWFSREELKTEMQKNPDQFVEDIRFLPEKFNLL